MKAESVFRWGPFPWPAPGFPNFRQGCCLYRGGAAQRMLSCPADCTHGRYRSLRSVFRVKHDMSWLDTHQAESSL